MALLKRHIVETEDGSKTLLIPEWDERYHSIHGAKQESNHIFIETGLDLLTDQSSIKILELGFGTGLNALLSLQWAHKNKIITEFTSLEKYPLKAEEYNNLEYGYLVEPDLQSEFMQMHESDWEKDLNVSEYFQLHKKEIDFKLFESEPKFNGIFFDAFAPELQANLWTVDIFSRFYKVLLDGGFLVTYCAKGQVRRNMIEAGFKVERLPGPPGKREMLRATK